MFLTLIDAAHDNGSAVLCGASNLTPRCFPTLIPSEPMNRLLFGAARRTDVRPTAVGGGLCQGCSLHTLVTQRKNMDVGVGGLNSDGRLLPRAYKASSRRARERIASEEWLRACHQGKRAEEEPMGKFVSIFLKE